MGYEMVKHSLMNYTIGISKGLHAVLEERGINMKGMNAEKIKFLIATLISEMKRTELNRC